MNRRTATTLILAMLAFQSRPAHAGGTVAAAQLTVGLGDTYQCTVVNMGLKEIASVTVSLAIAGDEATGISGSQTCAPLATNGTCTGSSVSADPGLRLCRIVGKGNLKAIRGKFCNTTTGECEEVR